MGCEPEDSDVPTGDRPRVPYLKDWHFVKDLGLLFMLMCSGHIAGLRMCVGRNSGFSCLPHSVILCSTGI